MTQKIHHIKRIPIELAGSRLDKAIASIFPEYSRSLIKQWIDNQWVTVDGKHLKPKDILHGEEEIILDAELSTQQHAAPEEIHLDIIYEDEDILIINKPVGLVVHPGAGNPNQTLLNALLHHEPALTHVPRAGMIHRIDKDTSGLLVIAKNIPAHTFLVDALQKREIKREYEAVINGTLISGGKIDAPIGRHTRQRLKMTVKENGKPAITHYRIIKKFKDYAYISVNLETGRTHQIRVHMTHIHHPIVGDPVYGGRLKLPKEASQKLIETLQTFKRQALHAKSLTFIHPRTKEQVSFSAPLPQDMQDLLEKLQENEVH